MKTLMLTLAAATATATATTTIAAPDGGFRTSRAVAGRVTFPPPSHGPMCAA